MVRAVVCLISRCLGIGAAHRPLAGLRYIVWSAPSRSRQHPSRSRCRIRSTRFMWRASRRKAFPNRTARRVFCGVLAVRLQEELNRLANVCAGLFHIPPLRHYAWKLRHRRHNPAVLDGRVHNVVVVLHYKFLAHWSQSNSKCRRDIPNLTSRGLATSRPLVPAMVAPRRPLQSQRLLDRPAAGSSMDFRAMLSSAQGPRCSTYPPRRVAAGRHDSKAARYRPTPRLAAPARAGRIR